MEVEVIKKKEQAVNNIIDDNKKKIRVAAYARVSTDRDEQQSSFESQQKYYIDKISKEKGWIFVEVYADEGITGTQTKKREDFLRMIRDAEDGKIDLILTKSISRFARNTVDTLKYVRLLKSKNVAIMFEEENILTTDMQGELLLTILSSVAQQESETISSHVRLGMKMKAQRGEMIGFNGIYGYDCEMKKNKMSINPKEAKIVKLIFKLYLEGKGCNVIARTLNEMGVETPRKSSKWHYSTINKILHNEKYIGDLEMCKSYTVDPISHQRKPNNGEEDKYYVKDHHEAIISRDAYQKVQEIFLSKQCTDKFARFPKFKNNYFTSKIRCGFCGETYLRRREYRRQTVWACNTYLKKGRYYCDNSKVCYENIVKNAFVEGMNMLLNKDEFDIDEFMKDLSYGLDEDQNYVNLKRAERKKEELEEKMEKLIELLLNKGIDNDLFDKKRQKYLEDLKEQERRIEKYSGEPNIDNKERIIEMRSKILTDINTKKQTLSAFDDKIFSEIVLYVVVGGYIDDDKVDPYMLRFIIKENADSDISSKLSKEFVVKHNNIERNKTFYKTVLDFKSKQVFNSFEYLDKGFRKIAHDSVRVRFEIENY